MSTTHERARPERAELHPRPGTTDVRAGIDPRGPQLTAALTAVVLAAVLLLVPHPVGTALLAAQVALFAVGAVAGVQRTPHAWLFRTLVGPASPRPPSWRTPPRRASPRPSASSSARSGCSPCSAGATVVGQVAVGLALAPPCSTPSSRSAWAARCTSLPVLAGLVIAT